MSITELFLEISDNFQPIESKSPINVLVEAGPILLQQMIDLSLIENLYLTKNLEKDGENKISIDKLTQSFKLLASERVESCEFMHYQKR
jgi:riboflavin biosynthesis pyrimidine reductase